MQMPLDWTPLHLKAIFGAMRHATPKTDVGADAVSGDLLVVGGGMVGLSLALAVAQAGLSIVVVERKGIEAMTASGFDGRVTSVSYGSRQMFDGLGVWTQLEPLAEPILDIRVADGRSPLYLHFDHRDVGERPFGYMVENRHIRAALLASVHAHKDIRFLCPASVERLDRSCDRVVATLDGGRQAVAPLTAAADGRFSPLREEAGIRTLAWQYRQTAIVTTTRHERPHHGVAKEHFLPAGPFALLPMQNSRSAVVWTEQTAAAPAMMALDDEAFSAEIARRAGDHLGHVELDGPRWSHPLGLSNAERYDADRMALVGDAAHAMHPIAGQGFNLGLRDAAHLAELIVDAARLGLDIGAPGLLQRYSEYRRWDALTMLLMTDGLNRLFSNDMTPLRLARDLGLGLVNRIGPAKRLFERHASAMSGDLPRLMRGKAI